MSDKMKKSLTSGKPLGRAEVLTLLQVALQAGEPHFVRQLAEEWLNTYPYDLPIERLRAEAWLNEAKPDKAVKILSRLVELDPEYLEAQELLASVARRVKPAVAEQARAAAAVLRNQGQQDVQTWARSLIRAQCVLDANELQKAETEIQTALLSEPPTPLPALFHLKLAQAQQLSWHAVRNLVELYRQEWPQCLQLRLMDAAQRMEAGQENEAVDILHECVAEDVSGQVARRLWGEGHRFAALWPSELKLTITLPIPAAVAAAFNWNHLTTGAEKPIPTLAETKAPVVAQLTPAMAAESKAAPEEAQAGDATQSDFPKLKRPKIQRAAKPVNKDVYIDELGVEYPVEKPKPQAEAKTSIPEALIELEELATKAEDLLLRADGRKPAYIALSAREPLEEQYGVEGFLRVEEALKAVTSATAADPYWNAHLIYTDDKNSLAKFNLDPVKASDPWEVKHLLADLDEALRKQGEMIGAVLIVGGPQIIPFHHLPNPVDDEDKDVPSDNPYASIDENYFVPSWPLGRLPNGEGSDPAPLIKALTKIVASRGKHNGPIDSVEGLLARILAFLGLWRPKRSSFGYSAEIWRRASHSVYRTIGEPTDLSISPPTGTGMLPKEASKALQLAYFNLHGLAETAEWYGQRDPQQTADGPDYPVALRPSDVVNSGRAPQIVFSEACFGAHIFGKTIENALALKFLDSGSKAVVASTVTSYGSVTTPLIAADLLGQAFWKLLNEGHPAGEALRRAKIAMAQTMHRRQGYLDGEDQKTLISFVLYGDPLAQVVADGDTPKRILRPESNSDIKAICDRGEGHNVAMQELPAETLATVKSVVAEYLPGMQGSQATYSHEHVNCRGHNCTLPHAHMKAVGLAPTRSLVTLSKKIPSGNYTHPQYARITMDARGKVVKLAVSR